MPGAVLQRPPFFPSQPNGTAAANEGRQAGDGHRHHHHIEA